MKRITLAMFVVTVAAVPAVAQDPVPPARPVPAPRTPPTPSTPRAVAPAIAPIAPIAPIDREWVREQSDEARRAAEQVRDFAYFDRIDAGRIREEAARAVEMSRTIDRAAIADAREASRAAIEATRDMNWGAIDAAREQMRAVEAAMPRDFAVAPMAPIRPIGGVWGGDGIRPPRFPASLGQGDPLDSLYKSAREALSNGSFGAAARMFADIQKRYPSTSYQNDLQYYEALSRYRIGTTDELRQASKLLEPLADRSPSTSTSRGAKRYYNSEGDVVALYARVNNVLAQRGDKDAADRIAKLAAQRGPAAACDREQIQVQNEAMNALSQMDAQGALPMLKRVLERKDECSVELRRNAVFMLGRRGDAESAALIAATAKSDPSTSVRVSAISWLPKLQGDAGVGTLEDLLRTEQDEQVQRAVVQTLMTSDNAKARSSMRALIDRKDVPVSLRLSVLNSFNADRSTPDDAAYLRNNYSKIDNDQVKGGVIGAIARIGGAENEQWLLRLANNPNEPSQLRAVAVSRLVRANNVSIADLSKLYDNADSYDVRRQIVNVLGSRKEPEATDKLIDIVKNSTVANLRSQAINALVNKKDQRAQQLLLDMVGKP